MSHPDPKMAISLVATARPKDLLMISMSRFYSDPEHMKEVIAYITCASGVSLRLIDWFVTNYAKRHNVVIHRDQSHFNVHLSYRAQLKAYSKQMFDPFRRRDRIIFHYSADQSVETTIGQLNFFRWMLENGVLDYVGAHAEKIEQDMLHVQRSSGRGDVFDRVNVSAAVASASATVEAAHGDADTEAAAMLRPKKRSDGPLYKANRNMTRIAGMRTLEFD
jgi:hypothetical protein